MSLSDITAPEPEPIKEEEAVENPTVVSSVSTEKPPTDPSTTAPITTTLPSPANKSFLDIFLEKAVPIDNQRTPRKMMIFSHPGHGKTTLLGQIPNSLFIDTEDGRTVLKENKELMGENVRVLPFKSFAGLEATYLEFQKDPEELKDIKTIVIDTVNNLKKRGLTQVLARQHALSPNMNSKYIPGDDGKEHQEVNEQMRQIIQGFIDTGRDVIISAHAKTFEYKNKQDSIRPDFSEGLGNTLMGMVDTVAFMYLAEIEGETKRVIKFNPVVGTNERPEIATKTRIKALKELDTMIDPTWDKIVELWKD